MVAFFGVIAGPLLVRGGMDVKLPKGNHTRTAVYTEMYLQVIRDYAGIGDFRHLTETEIAFLYDGLRHELKEATKGK